MADENTNPAVAAPSAVTPNMPDVTRQSVPASAVFGAEDNEPIPGVPPTVTPATPEKKETPAAPAAPAAPATPETPATPEKKETPAAPAAPAAPATPAAPEATVKIAGKEYKVSELEKLISNPPAAPAQPAPATPAAPAAPETKPPTPEEVAAQETQWCQDFQKNTKLGISFTKEDVEKLLEGGEDAARLLSDKFNPVLARAVLETRKSIYAELNPYFEQANAAMKPLLEHQAELDRVATEQVFVNRHKDFANDKALEQARAVASALVEQYPTQVSQMSREQFVDEVAAQTDRILQANYKAFNPNATDTWKDAVKRAATPAAPAAPAVPATPAAPAAPIVPATPAAPVVQAPNANSPAASTSASGSQTPDQKWHKDTAASLVD